MGDRVEEITARLAAATPGPWESRPDRTEARRGWKEIAAGRSAIVHVQSFTRHSGGESSVHCGVWISDANAALIAHAPDDLAFLLAEVERLARERDEALAELEVERRKDHAYNAWTGGYEAAVADWQAGRTALWPAARPATPEVAP